MLLQNLRPVHLSMGTKGGAAIAALRIHAAIKQFGVDSRFLVADKMTPEPEAEEVPDFGDASCGVTSLQISRGLQGFALNHYPQRDPNREFFSTLTRSVELENLPIADRNLMHLHWVTQMTDPALDTAQYAGRPLIWTLHDMNAFTGGCHYADECDGFTRNCGQCPQLRSNDPQDLSFWTWLRRYHAYQRLAMHIVCPSHWLAEQVRRSSLLGSKPVHVIANPVPADVFQECDRVRLRAELGFDEDVCLLTFSAQSLKNIRKGGTYLVEALQRLASSSQAVRLAVLLLGDEVDQAFMQTGIPVHLLGYLDSPAAVAAAYGCCDALILPSRADNLPNVIIESLACGTPAVAFSVGGIPEMIRHGETGYLVNPEDVDDLVEGIRWACAVRGQSSIREACRQSALHMWSAPQVASQYVQLYEAALLEFHAPNTQKMREESAPSLESENEMPCRVTEGERPLRIMHIHTYCDYFIRYCYEVNPKIQQMPFAEQEAYFRDSGYDATHIHARELAGMGCDVEFVAGNAPAIRAAWAREQGLPTEMDESEYLLHRVAAFCPDVLYVNNMNLFQAPFLAALQPRPHLIMGWHGSDLYSGSDWHGYDVLLSGLTGTYPYAEQLGVRHCRWFAPGAPEWVARQVADLPQDIDIVFSGSLSPSQHVYRLNALSAVAELAAREGFSFAAHLMCNPEEMPDVLRPFLQPPVFGMDMQRALRRGRIVVDDRAWHGLWSTEGKSLDLGGEETVNMRLFEGTVGGSLVITPALKGLARYFEDGKEVVGYTDHDDMVAKIFYYLTHEEERQAIAEAGKARALRDHNLTVRARQLLEIVHEFL